jgi:hypothetical protein
MRATLIFLFLCSLFADLVGQEKLCLENSFKPFKKKYIDIKQISYIKTNDTTYKLVDVIAYNDTALLIHDWVKTNKDTTYSFVREVKKGEKVTYSYKTPIYELDTIFLNYNNLQLIKKDWFKNKKWLEPFGWCLAGAAIGILILPAAVLDSSMNNIRDWAIMEAILVGISIPPLFIGTRKRKFNLTNKWIIKPNDTEINR